MKTKKLCNDMYLDLCAKLGELTIQKKLIDDQVNAILAQLNLLNTISPELQKIEQDITKE